MQEVLDKKFNGVESVEDVNITALSRTSLEEMVIGLLQEKKSLLRIILVLAVGLIFVSLLSGIGYFRRPKVLVAVQSADGQRIAKIDDVNFGATEQIQMGEDKLTNRDKRELVENFLQSLYGVDLASRSKDVPKALSMMIPQAANAYYKTLNEQGVLQRERDEGWNASWKTDSFEIDRSDKNIAQVLGTQSLRKVFGGKTVSERIQYKLTFTLHTEGKRDDTPLRTGYWIANFKAEEISRTAEGS